MGNSFARPKETSLRNFIVDDVDACLVDEDEPLISASFYHPSDNQILAFLEPTIMSCTSSSEIGLPIVDSDLSELINDDSTLSVNNVSEQCRCHRNKPIKSHQAQNRLIAAAILCLIFMICELVGGLLAGSVAVMTDAAHLLSDFSSFLISLFAIWIGNKSPSKRMSLGYDRAEILGALLSILVIWVLTGILVYVAIDRVIHSDYTINANIMLIVSGVGVIMNIIMGLVLHGSCNHAHSHSFYNKSTCENHTEVEHKNINVRAAFIHVIGDLIQSIGVFIAAIIIKFYPDYKIADPLCTFIFSILVLLTTSSVLFDTVNVLMEGFPTHIKYDTLKKDLESIEGVFSIHDLQVWSLTMGKSFLSAHIVVGPGIDFALTLERSYSMLRNKYQFHRTALQVEDHVPSVTDSCRQCQLPIS